MRITKRVHCFFSSETFQMSYRRILWKVWFMSVSLVPLLYDFSVDIKFKDNFFFRILSILNFIVKYSMLPISLLVCINLADEGVELPGSKRYWLFIIKNLICNLYFSIQPDILWYILIGILLFTEKIKIYKEKHMPVFESGKCHFSIPEQKFMLPWMNIYLESSIS